MPSKPVSLRALSESMPTGDTYRINPRLLSQLRAAVERGETVPDALRSMGITSPTRHRRYAEALSSPSK